MSEMANEKEKMTNVEKFNKTKKIYVIMMSLYGLADKLYGSIYIAFMRSSNLSMLQISNLFSIEQILIAVFDYPTGTISDKVGRKKLASYGFLIWGTSLLIFAHANGYGMFLVSMIIMALGLALISGAPGSWLIDHMISDGVYDQRTKIFPKIQATVSLFAIVASLLSYFFIDISNNLPIIIAGLISIFIGLFAWFCGEDNYGDTTETSLLKTLNENLRSFMKDNKMLLLTVRRILSYISFVCFVLYWQIYVTETLNIEAKFLPIFLILFMLSLTLGNYLSSVIVTKISNFSVSIVGLIISAIGFIMLIFGNTVVIFIIGSLFVEIGFGIKQAITPTWTADYIESEVRASYSSIFSTIQSICGFFIINVLGYLFDIFGLNTIWTIAAITLVIESFIVILFVNKFKKSAI